MNERVMQFRIGLFVIVAGLVLMTLIIWFGESPSLFRDHAFVRVRFVEAPGLAEGITVRKSGIRIGEVVSVELDEQPGEPDGVMVVLSLERKYKIKKGSVARITRSLIGDVSIDMMPGSSTEILTLGDTAATGPVIAGDVTPDPSKALAAATAAFEKVGGTLAAIEAAANGFTTVAKKAENIDQFIRTFEETGRDVSKAAKGMDRVIAENTADLRPAITNLRQATDKFNAAFDAEAAAKFRLAILRFESVTSQLDAGMNDLRPVFADLGASANSKSSPTTNLGQAFFWLNRAASNVGVLTRGLTDGKGNLNPNGSFQRMVSSPELYDNLSRVAASANEAFALARPAIRNLAVFAQKIAQDPGAIGRGVLQK